MHLAAAFSVFVIVLVGALSEEAQHKEERGPTLPADDFIRDTFAPLEGLVKSKVGNKLMRGGVQHDHERFMDTPLEIISYSTTREDDGLTLRTKVFSGGRHFEVVMHQNSKGDLTVKNVYSVQ